jgi:aryl-alcohol dehydrogenase-like predicted oxidoreductase
LLSYQQREQETRARTQEGKIRYVGVSNHDVTQMQEFERTRKIDTLQTPYHLFRRDIEEAILPDCREHGIGVLVYGPLGHGLLTGSYPSRTTFSSDNWRSKSLVFHGDLFARNLAVVDQLKGVVWRLGISVAQGAVAWVLAHPAVDVAIVGARHPRQLDETAQAADIQLTPQTLDEIPQIVRDAVPVGGPAPEGI